MLTSAAIVGGLCIGSLLAWLRLARQRWLTIAARTYIWIFRGTPLLVQLVIIYTGLPQIGIKFSVIESALIGLILNEAAYLAEIIRGGILAVPAGQSDAGRALGLSPAQVMMHIVLPQATRIIIPAIGNRFMVLELFAVASLYYLLMTSAWNVVQRRIETHFGRAHRTIAISNVH
jgi:polar amino acid transport system permease protein